MNIVLFVNRDIEANIAFNLLKPELLEHSVRVYYSDAVGGAGDKHADLLNLEYFEQDFVYEDLLNFAKTGGFNSDFEFFDERDFQSFPIEKCTGVNTASFKDEIKSFAPDLFISIRFGKIFKDEILQLPRHGTLNLHSGILPDFRGIMATLHALKAGNQQLGCTVHTIPDSGIDTGQIVEKARLPVNADKSLLWHIVQLYPRGAELLVKYIKKVKIGSYFQAEDQETDKGNYFSVPTAHDFAAIRDLGMRVFSPDDYTAILKEFVFSDIDNEQAKQLTALVEEKWRNLRNSK